jgi:ribosome-associated translation inhibitor RaiA
MHGWIAKTEDPMLTPQITYRNMQASDAVEAEVLRRAEWLARFHPGLTSCRVAIEAPHGHHRQGEAFHVRIELSVPGAEIVVSHGDAKSEAHTDVYLAVRDAFRVARRELQDALRVRRGQVKTHPSPLL